jgi:sensor histidine kinase regulating citrate/malate metabolism
LHIKKAEASKMKAVNREFINKEKETAKEHLDNIRTLYTVGKNDEALTYINKYIKEQTESAAFVTDCICVNNLVDHYKRITEHKNIVFKYNVPNELHYTECNLKITRKALNTFLGNFLDNGIDALEVGNKEQKVLSLDITTGESYVIYKVSNNGKKIKDISKIFEPRYSTKGMGRGFGLVASERAIQSINGQVSVISTDDETTFEVVVNL